MSAPPTCKTCGVRTDLSDNQGYSRCSRHRDKNGNPIDQQDGGGPVIATG